MLHMSLWSSVVRSLESFFNFHHSYTTIHDTTGGKPGLKTGTPGQNAHCHFGAQGVNTDSKIDMSSSLRLWTCLLLVSLQAGDNTGRSVRSVLPSRCHQPSSTPAPRCRFGAELDECGQVIKCLRGPGEFCGER